MNATEKTATAEYQVVENIIDPRYTGGVAIANVCRWDDTVESMDEAEREFCEAVESGAYDAGQYGEPGEYTTQAILELRDADDEIVDERKVTATYRVE